MESFDHHQKPGDEVDKNPKPPLWLQIQPVILAGAVVLLVLSIASFVYSPDFGSLIGIVTAIIAFISITTIKNKKINWMLAGVLVVVAVVGFIIVRRETDPEKIVIVGIFYDGVKDQEADEYVVIRNEDTKAIQLENWTLSDDQSNHVFTFPRYEIQPDQECRIYTNEDHPDTCGFKFGSGGSGVWNNGGDIASLRNAEGELIDESTDPIIPSNVESAQIPAEVASIPTPTLPAEYDEFVCIPRDTPREVGLVVGVIDGRTIDVQLGDGSIVRVRYLGVATIVEGQPIFDRSVEINKELVLNQDVTLVEDAVKTENDDVLLRYVFVGDNFVNDSLISGGYAVPDHDCSCLEHFINMNMGASELERGFYSAGVEVYGDPFSDTPPEDFFNDRAVPSDNLVITDIFYDGVKSKKEPDEYVEIRNDGIESIQLNGWTLSDKSNHCFVFPSFMIAPGQSCRLYTNEDHDESCGFNYKNTETAIWGNDGDCATLRDREGFLIDEYCY